MARNWRPILEKNLEYAPRQPKEPPRAPRAPKGGQMEPQREPNGPQWEANGSQREPNGPQREPNGPQSRAKGNQRRSKDTKRKPRGQAIYSQTPDPPPKRPTSITYIFFPASHDCCFWMNHAMNSPQQRLRPLIIRTFTVTEIA